MFDKYNEEKEPKTSFAKNLVKFNNRSGRT